MFRTALAWTRVSESEAGLNIASGCVSDDLSRSTMQLCILATGDCSSPAKGSTQQASRTTDLGHFVDDFREHSRVITYSILQFLCSEPAKVKVVFFCLFVSFFRVPFTGSLRGHATPLHTTLD